MATNNDITELFERFTRIENEIKLLRDDKKQLFEEFKDRIGTKAFQAALRSVKIKARLKPEEIDEFDQAMHIIESEISIDHIS